MSHIQYSCWFQDVTVGNAYKDAYRRVPHLLLCQMSASASICRITLIGVASISASDRH